MNYLTTYRPGTFSLGYDLDRVLDSFFTDAPFWKTNTPSVDIQEEEKRYILEAELPGFGEKDLEIKVEENLLTISSKEDIKKETKEKEYLLKERKRSSFSRSFVLPKNADKEKIAGTYKNGILTIDIPKAPEVKPKVIDVKVN